MTSPQTDSERAASWLPSLVAGALALAVGYGFARHQEIWMDETTQLSGISLGPVEVVRWLAGNNRNRFAGIPGDRMPPISYWLQWLWSRLFGFSELSLRLLGAVAMGIAVAVIARAAARAWGNRAGWFAGLTLALSPNAILIGAEIRAYPFLMLFSACAFSFALALLRGEGRGSTRTWIGLWLSCLAASYSHYFGLVMTGAVFTALAIVAWKRDAMRKPLAAFAGAMAVGAVGLVPFVKSAAGMQPGKGKAFASVGYSLARLAYRTMGGHASWALFRPVMIAGVLGAVIALGVALARRESSARPARLLAIAIVAGVGVELAVRLVASKFDAIQPTYNMWIPPAMVLIGASAVAAENARLRTAGTVGSALLLVANLVAAMVLVVHGDAFAHSAGDRINAEVAALGSPDDVVVVHESTGATTWEFGFCPLQYVYGPAVKQYLAEWLPDGRVRLHREPGDTSTETLESLRGKHLALIHVEDIGAEGVVHALRTSEPPAISDDHLRDAFVARGWAPSKSETLVAMCTEKVDWLTPPP